jgi:molecular chaperone DnaJ
LEEAFSGVKKNLRIETWVACEACAGAGHFAKEGFDVCKTCDGRGEIRETKKSFFGAFARVVQCGKCRGLGKIPKHLCAKCSGVGRLKGERKVDIDLASGISDSQIIKISGMGEAGESGTGSGDLYVHVRVKPHGIFSRAGDDLIIKQSAPLLDILLEKPIKIKTISGKNIEVKVPADFNLKNKIRISGEGMPRFGFFGRGDLYLDLEVKTPKKLNSEAKKILEKLDKEL